MRKLLIFFLFAAFLTSCLPPAPGSGETAPASGAEAGWWTDAVFYEIFVRSFNDSNGDGIGDFNGITQKLDYLNDGDPATSTDLGVTAIWLMPIFPSPSYHGYDVTDYYSVNPQYGTMDDFKTLLNEAHRRGMHVIIDLVLNHTSDQHPWFKDAKKNIHSPYRDWYIWSETKPGYRGPWNETVWHSSTTGFYYGIFTANMPDLNYDNPKVTKEMDKIVAFWLKDVGVDGFRLDAAKHLIENGSTQQNTSATHDWYVGFRKVYKAIDPSAMTVGEISGDPASVLAKYTGGDQLDLAFDFPLANAYVRSANSGVASYAVNALKTDMDLMPDGAYSPFLTNHDQDRLMSQLDGNIGKAKVAAALLLTSPGVPFIYYGEEIGMTGKKPDENIRRPMQWSNSANAGFTTGTPWRAPDGNFSVVNVAAQTSDAASLLAVYRALIQTRNAHPSLRTGDIFFPSTGNSAVFASLRTSGSETMLVLINLSENPVSDYKLELGDLSGKSLLPLYGTVESELSSTASIGPLMPYSVLIFQMK
jgi:glycosidase